MRIIINENLLDYKSNRNNYIEGGNNCMACYFQALIINTIEKSPFYFSKIQNLHEQWNIFNDILKGLLGFYEKSYFKGVYHEIILTHMLQEEVQFLKESELSNKYFRISKIRNYTFETIGFHVICIKYFYIIDKKLYQLYVKNILLALSLRYGKNSEQYAKIELHILGECIYCVDKNEFNKVFLEKYEYFEKYLVYYPFYIECVFLYIIELPYKSNENFWKWIKKLETLIEQNKNSEDYYYFKSKLSTIIALNYEKNKNNEMAINILEYAIRNYVIKDDKDNLFYIYMYKELAANYSVIHRFDKMLEVAELGLEICESINATNTELYYLFYDCIGRKLIYEKEYLEAEQIYNKGMKYIEEHFGKESESYIIYTNNLGLIAMLEARIGDAKRYFEELNNIIAKSTLETTRFYKGLIKQNLYVLSTIERMEDNIKLNLLYKSALENIKDNGRDCDVLLLTYMKRHTEINNNILNEVSSEIIDELKMLIENLKNNIADFRYREIKNVFLEDIVLYYWKNRQFKKALEISEELITDSNSYENINIIMRIHNIQLLIINGKYTEALKYILELLDDLYNMILDMGFGNITVLLSDMRLVLSICITMLNKYQKQMNISENRLILVFERIIECKTIEKEILRLRGKFKGESDIVKDIYWLNNLHRKIAALEIRNKLKYENVYEKIYKYSLEKEALEYRLRSKINLKELIPKFKLNNLKISERDICVEYFAYYNISIDEPLNESEYIYNQKSDYNYKVFILYMNNNGIHLKSINDFKASLLCIDEFINIEEKFAQECLDDKNRRDKIKIAFNKVLIEPLFPYIKLYHRIYWALDFELQKIPFEIMEINGKPIIDLYNNIYIDSIRYITSFDKKLDLEDVEALIIGNPKYKINIKGKYKETPILIDGELEVIEIANILNTKAFTGKEANQKIFREEHKKDILHISTHGDVFLDKTSLMFYSQALLTNSYILLAGYDDWKNNEAIEEYGNGLISGDDFIFTDLSNTKLVVLAACCSGLGVTAIMEIPHGLRWALSISGAKYSITALWKVDNSATAILMILFYRNLKDSSISEALRIAKIRLSNITIQELLNDDLFKQIIKKRDIDLVDKEYKPFNSWLYWAAFVCYCN